MWLAAAGQVASSRRFLAMEQMMVNTSKGTVFLWAMSGGWVQPGMFDASC